MPTIDITTAAELTKQVNNHLPPKRFLSTFFRQLTHNTKDVMIDFVEGSQTLAPFIRDGQAATISNRGGFSTRSVHCYDIALKRITTAFDCLKRLPGEAPVVAGAISPNERASQLAAMDMEDLMNKVNRTTEKCVSDALFTGVVNITDVNGNTIDTLNLGAKATHLDTTSKGWSASNYKGIVEDIDKAAILIAKDSGLTATDVVLGSDAANYAMKNDHFLKMLDTKNLNAGNVELTTKLQGNGARLLGIVDGMRVWRYDEIFKDGSGNVNQMVPADKVLVIAADLAATLHYGVTGDIENGFFEGEASASTWYEKDPSAQWLRVRSAPLPVIEQIDGVAVFTA